MSKAEKIYGIIIFVLVVIIMVLGFVIVGPKHSNQLKECYTTEIESVVKYEYDGHSYIKFIYKNGDANVVHDPDCQCLEDLKELVNQMLLEYYD